MRDVTDNRNLWKSPAGLLLIGAACGLLWSYWSTLCVLAGRWGTDPQYSHGFIVPLVAVGLIWQRRGMLRSVRFSGAWSGVALIGLSVVMRLAAARFYFEWFDWLSLVPAVAGLCLLAGGWPAWRCAWPGILFLTFMLPLPYRLETLLSGPLQSVATLASTFSLQTLGFPAVSEGNVIVIDESRVGVAEACSGLRMLVVFFATATAVAVVSRRPLWERLLLVGSAVPIAVICNVVRITVTGMLYETSGPQLARLVYHDLAGWLMMLMAVGLLRLELWLLANILVEPPPRDVVPVLSGRSGMRAETLPPPGVRRHRAAAPLAEASSPREVQPPHEEAIEFHAEPAPDSRRSLTGIV